MLQQLLFQMRRMEKDDLSDLENLYVEKIQSFDEERQKFNSYTNLIKIDQRELHILQWDSRQQTENSESRSAELIPNPKPLLRKLSEKWSRQYSIESFHLSIESYVVLQRDTLYWRSAGHFAFAGILIRPLQS